MADLELRNIDTTDPLMRSFSKKNNNNNSGDLGPESTSPSSSSSLDGCYIETDFGPTHVIRIGAAINSGKPYIITYHDIGLNFHSNFQAFFNFQDMKLLLESFCVLNVHAPGQEENAPPLPDGYCFPSMDQLAQQVDCVCRYFGVTNFVGFGVGAGANVLARYALMYPEQVDGLFLIHPTSTQASWTEWLYQRINIYYLSSAVQSFSQTMQDYLLWHHFGNITEDRNRDLIEVYRNYFSGKHHNSRNLAMFLDSYIKRTDLNVERGNRERNFKCTVLILCGSLSPHVDDTVNMNGRLNPENSTWMKLSGCGMVLEEQPFKVAEAFRLFLQGLGYALTAYERRRSLNAPRRQSDDDVEYDCTNSATSTSVKMHIVENPIAHC